jgi:hypothetical protein
MKKNLFFPVIIAISFVAIAAVSSKGPRANREDCSLVRIDSAGILIGREQGRFSSFSLKSLQASGGMMLLDFERSRLCEIDRLENGFEMIQCKTSKGSLFIKGNLRYKEVWFKIDFSYAGYISLPAGVKYQKLLESRDLLKVMPAEGLHPRWVFGFNRLLYSVPLEINSRQPARLGVGFIQAFDWVYDSKSKKLYCRKNNNSLQQ